MPSLLRHVLLAALAAMLPGACAVNPVTGQSDFVLMSEEQEIKIGRDAAPQIIKEFGQYEGQALQDYVQRVGEKLAANSHRANLVYRFTVLDTADVNAFALPGGYIYITRGLLAYLDSEAELAAVLGHEIGHVTARHSVRQQSAAQAADLGYTLGSILLPELRNQAAQQAFSVVGGALLSGYGREHELEADRLGAEYLARSGYDPQAIIKVIGVLKDQESFERQLAREEGREARVYHGLFATHPDNDTRLQQVVASAEQFRGGQTTEVRRDDYLRALDGLTFGDSEKEGVRRGSAFYHADLGFALN
ncbi:MAG: M48 family metalloprotease, partial [Gammaproteobacteria bacterium]